MRSACVGGCVAAACAKLRQNRAELARRGPGTVHETLVAWPGPRPTGPLAIRHAAHCSCLWGPSARSFPCRCEVLNAWPGPRKNGWPCWTQVH